MSDRRDSSPEHLSAKEDLPGKGESVSPLGDTIARPEGLSEGERRLFVASVSKSLARFGISARASIVGLRLHLTLPHEQVEIPLPSWSTHIGKLNGRELDEQVHAFILAIRSELVPPSSTTPRRAASGSMFALIGGALLAASTAYLLIAQNEPKMTARVRDEPKGATTSPPPLGSATSKAGTCDSEATLAGPRAIEARFLSLEEGTPLDKTPAFTSRVDFQSGPQFLPFSKDFPVDERSVRLDRVQWSVREDKTRAARLLWPRLSLLDSEEKKSRALAEWSAIVSEIPAHAATLDVVCPGSGAPLLVLAVYAKSREGALSLLFTDEDRSAPPGWLAAPFARPPGSENSHTYITTRAIERELIARHLTDSLSPDFEEVFEFRKTELGVELRALTSDPGRARAAVRAQLTRLGLGAAPTSAASTVL